MDEQVTTPAKVGGGLEDVKPYLDYLDKEMTIMGILSAFSVAASGLVIERATAAAKDTQLAQLWGSSRLYLVLGSGYLILAALFFYRQRSLLAFYYGQICLSMSPYRDEVQTTYGGLRDADSWATWLYYRWGFAFVTLGFLEYGIAFARTLVPVVAARTEFVTIYGPAVVVVAAFAVHAIVLSRYRYSESPWSDVLRRRGH